MLCCLPRLNYSPLSHVSVLSGLLDIFCLYFYDKLTQSILTHELPVFGLGFWICLVDESNKALANITSIVCESKHAGALLCKCHLMLKLWISPCSHGELQKELNVKWDFALGLRTHTAAFSPQNVCTVTHATQLVSQACKSCSALPPVISCIMAVPDNPPPPHPTPPLSDVPGGSNQYPRNIMSGLISPLLTVTPQFIYFPLCYKLTNQWSEYSYFDAVLHYTRGEGSSLWLSEVPTVSFLW